MIKHSLSEVVINEQSLYAVTLEGGEFEGVTFMFGGVRVNEDEVNDQATLSFDYEILNGEISPDRREAFEQIAGDLLVAFIREAIEKQKPLVYYGGTD